MTIYTMLGQVHMLVVVKSLCRGVTTSSLPEVIDQIKHTSQKILVMAGAGLSTPSGIPDFRTSTLKLKDCCPILGVQNTSLHCKGKLLRMYTQNIDGLERLSGLKEEHLVEAHGGFATASCIKCGLRQDSFIVKDEIMKGLEPRCQTCKGLVKPDITFFGEMLPKRFSLLSEIDASNTDFLIIIGTSLAVYPFAGLADMVGYDVPRLLVNRDSVGSIGSRANDSLLLGDIVQQIKTLVKQLEWMDDLHAIMNAAES